MAAKGKMIMNHFSRKLISTLSRIAFTIGLFASPSFADADPYNSLLQEHRLGLASACQFSHWMNSKVSASSTEGVGGIRFLESGPINVFEPIPVDAQKLLIENDVLSLKEIKSIKSLQVALQDLEYKKIFFVIDALPSNGGGNANRELETTVFHLSDKSFHCETIKSFKVLSD